MSSLRQNGATKPRKRLWMLVVAGVIIAVLVSGAAYRHMARMKRIDRLVANLASADTAVRADAMKRLSSLTDSGEIARLLSHLGDENMAVRSDIAAVAVTMGDRVIAPLEAAIRDFAVKPRGGSFFNLLGLGDAPDRANDRRNHALGGVPAILNHMGKPGADLTLKLLWDQDPDVREFVAYTMYSPGLGPEMLQVAMRALANPDVEVRVQAMMGLGWSRQQSAIEPLLGFMDDPDQRTRGVAAFALSWFADDPRVSPRLIRYVRDPGQTASSRSAAMRGLGWSKDPGALDALVSLLGDSDLSVRRAAADALAALQDNRKWAAIAALLGDSRQDVSDGAAEVFSKSVDPEEVQALSEAYPKANAQGRIAIVRTLTALSNLSLSGNNDLGGKRRLFDPEIPKAAKEALERLNAPVPDSGESHGEAR
jgi:HEAT repeat protein